MRYTGVGACTCQIIDDWPQLVISYYVIKQIICLDGHGQTPFMHPEYTIIHLYAYYCNKKLFLWSLWYTYLWNGVAYIHLELESKYNFHTKKSNLKSRLRNGGHSVSILMYLLASLVKYISIAKSAAHQWNYFFFYCYDITCSTSKGTCIRFVCYRNNIIISQTWIIHHYLRLRCAFDYVLTAHYRFGNNLSAV